MSYDGNPRSHDMTNSALRTIDVWVIIPERILLLDIAGPLEVLRRANVEQESLRFRTHYIGSSHRVVSSVGLSLNEISAFPDQLPDEATIIVPGSADRIAFAEDVSQEVVAKDERAIVQWLAGHIRPKHSLITICSGALLAARAGLLDGHACTTHHTECAELAALAPQATVFDNRLFVIDGNRYTSAGVTAGVDLMLHLVSTLTGHACALRIARHLAVYIRRQGAEPQLSPWLTGRNHLHPAVHRVQDAISGNPAAEWNLKGLATIANTSPRHLSRLFNEYAGMHVSTYISNLRVALAHQLLTSSRMNMEHIADRAGFGSSRQLRRAWRRSHHTSPAAVRA